jgi:gliding motility-associated-like protein
MNFLKNINSTQKAISSKIWLFVCVLLCIGTHSYADHCAGGHIELKAIDNTPGHYKVIVKIYFDEITGEQKVKKYDDGVFTILRKRDNFKMEDFLIFEPESVEPFIFTNVECAKTKNQKLSEIIHTKEIQLDPNQYDDPQGYYIVYENVYRNTNTGNLSNPEKQGYAFVYEFPALKLSGKIFPNSSPFFKILNGEFACVNQTYKLSMSAKDADGDMLKYSLREPVRGSGEPGLQTGYGEGYIKFKPLVWASGYSVNNMIKGTASDPLKIDPTSGILTITPTELGLFCFAIKVEEYRNINGTLTKIGELNREYQIYVTDCNEPTPEEPVITADGYPTGTTTISLCATKKVKLVSTSKTTWAFQWQKDDENIPNATTDTYETDEPGIYTVKISTINTCSRTNSAKPFTISFTPQKSKLSGISTVCDGNKAKLQAITGTGLVYKWYKDGSILTTETQSFVETDNIGKYYAIITNPTDGCESKSDTLQVKTSPLPEAKITTSNGLNKLCQGKTLDLLATTGTGYTYQWSRNGQTLNGEIKQKFIAIDDGKYKVVVKDANKCQKLSDEFEVEIVSSIVASIDSITPICEGETSIIHLLANPWGGEFSGTGITDKVQGFFDPKTAGVGKFDIKYSLSGTAQCQISDAKRTIIIAAKPKIKLDSVITTFIGGAVILRGEAGKEMKYEWSPNTFLNDDKIANPTSKPTQEITYELKVTNIAGCSAEGRVKIKVFDKIWTPNIFTPNNDLQNDIWELSGSEKYPDVEVSIYNRWGEVVFFSKGYSTPFDGTYKGEPLPTGSYAYRVVAPSASYILTGGLEIMR